METSLSGYSATSAVVIVISEAWRHKNRSEIVFSSAHFSVSVLWTH